MDRWDQINIALDGKFVLGYYLLRKRTGGVHRPCHHRGEGYHCGCLPDTRHGLPTTPGAMPLRVACHAPRTCASHTHACSPPPVLEHTASPLLIDTYFGIHITQMNKHSPFSPCQIRHCLETTYLHSSLL